jgi:hypothetical protein
MIDRIFVNGYVSPQEMSLLRVLARDAKDKEVMSMGDILGLPGKLQDQKFEVRKGVIELAQVVKEPGTIAVTKGWMIVVDGLYTAFVYLTTTYRGDGSGKTSPCIYCGEDCSGSTWECPGCGAV